MPFRWALATLMLFEAMLAQFKGAFVLVSHDRAFLDAVTQDTLFLRDARDRYLWVRDGRLQEINDLQTYFSAGASTHSTADLPYTGSCVCSHVRNRGG